MKTKKESAREAFKATVCMAAVIVIGHFLAATADVLMGDRQMLYDTCTSLLVNVMVWPLIIFSLIFGGDIIEQALYNRQQKTLPAL
jgi:hypothetical protein